MKIGFITGARSEYGVMKNVIRSLAADDRFNVCIIATGMHFQKKYGYTVSEIENDNLAPVVPIPCYTEEQREKSVDFTSLITVLYNGFQPLSLDAVYLIGDRLEAYAAALAAHFLKIPVIHFAGGQITEGAVDNIYRYNISNISSLHLITNKYAYERLLQIPVIRQKDLYLVGSSAVDNIFSFSKEKHTVSEIDERLNNNEYVLITYHSQTIGANRIPLCLKATVNTVINKGLKVLVTYPNNDDGSDAIIQQIEEYKENDNVIIVPNLGMKNYYNAILNSLFVVGNSSSGIIEVPYFSKFTINVGNRQQGRNSPKSVLNVDDNPDKVSELIADVIDGKYSLPEQEYIYGTGNSISAIKQAIITRFMDN